MRHQTVTHQKSKVFDPVGRCIYCGASSDLSREHVIPLGLGGGLILPKASCATCRTVTGKIEEICLKELYLDYRIRYKLPTRRPKERATHRPIYVDHGTHRETRYVPISEYPIVLMLPRFLNPPRILSGQSTSLHMPGMMVVYGDRAEIAERTGKFPNNVLFEHRYNLKAFVRMIAKIAHAYAVAELGIGALNPFLPEIIFWREPRLVSSLIGRASEVVPPIDENAMHSLNLGVIKRGNGWLAVVGLSLFKARHTPFFNIVAGDLLLNSDIVARYGLAQ